MTRRLMILAVVVMLMTAIAAPLQAKPKADLPKVTGGGVTQNYNSAGLPGGPPHLLTVGGFNAIATADLGGGLYEAKGNVQGKNVLEDGGSTVFRYHGKVVCLADRGTAAEAGAFELTDPIDPAHLDARVWEIRFEITKAWDANGDKIPLPPFPIYASYFVQDNGSIDYQDENFSQLLIPIADCGEAKKFDFEPHLNGNITVH